MGGSVAVVVAVEVDVGVGIGAEAVLMVGGSRGGDAGGDAGRWAHSAGTDGVVAGRPPCEDVLGGASLGPPGDEGACWRWWWWLWWSGWSAAPQPISQRSRAGGDGGGVTSSRTVQPGHVNAMDVLHGRRAVVRPLSGCHCDEAGAAMWRGAVAVQ